MEARIGRNNPDSLEVLSNLYSGMLRRRILAISVQAQPNQVAFIRDLQAHVSILHMSALVQLSDGNATTSSIARFYESLSYLSQVAAASSTGSAAVILPSPYIVYLMVFAFQLDILSRLCGILTAYKSAFEIGSKASVKWPADFADRFNGFLMDVCNLLWRSRAMTKTDPNALGCLCPEPTAATLRGYLMSVDREYSLAPFYGFSHNMLVCSLSMEALQQLERDQGTKKGINLLSHVGPASQRTLTALEKEGGARISWKEYRIGCLQMFHRYGVSGIRDLMFVTMKDLMKTQLL